MFVTTTAGTTATRTAAASRAALAWGTMAALLALGVYVRTLYPGLVGSGDTPKFQYLGRILGTAHPPGYPLYVVVSHLFSYLPIGSLAFRMNLLSAGFGAFATALAFLLQRRLGTPPMLAAATALALAFGRVFWSQATLAEVYTLAAAILLGVVWMLLAWAETRRPAWLLGAIGLSALGLGHHLTLVTFFPAFVLFALLTDARAVLRPRRLVAGTLLVALGLAQYGFIILRTFQHAPYLGCGATNLRELVAVVRGDAFQRHLFAFDLATLVVTRIPLVGRLVLAELSWMGVLLAVTGLVWMARRRRPAAALVVVGLAGILFFVLNYDVPDLGVFAIPAFLALWIPVGVALAQIAEAVRRRWGAGAAFAVSALAFALPAQQLGRNFAANDHSDRTFESRYFGALFEALPRRVAFAAENHAVDQMVLYMLHGEGWEQRLDARLAPPYAPQIEGYLRDGRAVYAFSDGWRSLDEHGRFVAAPLRLLDQPLPSALGSIPSGRIVIAAAGGSDGSIEELSRVTGSISGRTAVALGVGGLGDAHAGETLVREAGALISGATRAPTQLAAFGGPLGARIVVGGETVLETDSGILVAVLSSTGKVIDRHSLRATERWRLPFSSRALPLWQITRVAPCAAVANRGRVDVSREAAFGRLRVLLSNVRSSQAGVQLDLEGDRPLAPHLGHCLGAEAPHLTVETPPPARLPLRTTHVRLTMGDGGRPASCILSLGGMPLAATALANVERPQPGRALVCGLPPGGWDVFGPQAPGESTIFVGLDRALLGSGWSEVGDAEPLGYRTITADAAELVLSLARARDSIVTVRSRGPAESTLALEVDGERLAAQRLADHWSTIAWSVPARRWREGPNRLLLVPSTGRVEINYLRLRASDR